LIPPPRKSGSVSISTQIPRKASYVVSSEHADVGEVEGEGEADVEREPEEFPRGALEDEGEEGEGELCPPSLIPPLPTYRGSVSMSRQTFMRDPVPRV
jgi:hypothetical protein